MISLFYFPSFKFAKYKILAVKIYKYNLKSITPVFKLLVKLLFIIRTLL